jgi:hypothetical protein
MHFGLWLPSGVQETPGTELGAGVLLVGQLTPGIQTGVGVVRMGVLFVKQSNPGLHFLEVLPVGQVTPGMHFDGVPWNGVLTVRIVLVLTLQLMPGLQPALQGLSHLPSKPLKC